LHHFPESALRPSIETIVLMLAIAACSAESPPAENAAAPGNQAVPLAPPEPGTAGGLPIQAGTPASEPDGPIDPKSAEGAGQVVQSFGALIEQKRFGEARKLWAESAPQSQMSDAEFAAQYKDYSEVHLQVGAPGDMEGAAGSIYIDIPVVLYGRLANGRQFSRSGTATLRRVNEVPGSTEEQRRWHIAGIDFKPAN
jgi:hypothetical protein